MFLAQLFQVSWEVLFKPRFINMFFMFSLDNAVYIALHMLSVSYGFINIAASFVISGIDVTLDVITGVPQAIASIGGNPKPS